MQKLKQEAQSIQAPYKRTDLSSIQICIKEKTQTAS